MKYGTILFDLDGTIANNAVGITKSVAHALDFFGNKYESEKSLEVFIGPPLKEQFANFCNISPEKAEEYVKKYREYYSVKGIYQNELYDGIPDMLKTLKSMGKKIVLATSKPEDFAKTILLQNEIDPLFDFVAGALMNNTRTKKKDVILYALEQIGVSDTNDVVMVGDRDYDIIGAKETGIKSVGVTYGFGTRNELISAGADCIADDAKHLTQILSE